MINKNELIFAVDEENNPIEPVERQKAHAEGIWHRTTDIAVLNSNRELLVHKRSMLKDTGPGLWDGTFGGHTLAGVESITGAVEELKEETGLEVNPTDLEFIGIVKHTRANDKNKEFRYAYIYRWAGKMSDFKFEQDEVDDVKWVSMDVLKTNRDNNKEWSPMPYFDLLINKL